LPTTKIVSIVAKKGESVEEQTVSVDEASQALTDALNADINGEQE
jgi:DNA-directed RNA polymerase subunit beta'